MMNGSRLVNFDKNLHWNPIIELLFIKSISSYCVNCVSFDLINEYILPEFLFDITSQLFFSETKYD